MEKLLFLISFPMLAIGQNTEVVMSPKTAKIHAKALTIDTHADVPINMMKPGQAWKMVGRSAEI